jgi:hypothetical protein
MGLVIVIVFRTIRVNGPINEYISTKTCFVYPLQLTFKFYDVFNIKFNRHDALVIILLKINEGKEKREKKNKNNHSYSQKKKKSEFPL